MTQHYMDSKAAEEAREIRKIIRSIKPDQLSRSHRDVLMKLANVWIYHKNKGVIRPARHVIAKAVGCSVRTVSAALDILRKASILTVKRFGKGGRKPTEYALSFDKIREVFNPHGVTTKPGELAEIRRKSASSATKSGPKNRAIFAHVYNKYLKPSWAALSASGKHSALNRKPLAGGTVGTDQSSDLNFPQSAEPAVGHEASKSPQSPGWENHGHWETHDIGGFELREFWRGGVLC
ncbi:helix-turn-helix transcriptional regulator [Roseibium sp. RKSG952]|uniref:helix-turn-helix transcriptional regulator n=1 Tax=Roseibium sp. RKSG952 TaxID=2529384 RepID=UPI0012BC225E|nr:helix-turn-helix transcriptional regulator [Roseibium sp. RKSG952]MTH96560.1 transcriptional regulator [Roseibium sp. RKSG952]